MFDTIWALAAVEGEPPMTFVGRESGRVEKYANVNDLSSPVLVLSGHTAAITALSAISADDVYSASLDGTVRQWNAAAEVEGKRETRCIKIPCGVRCLLVAGDVVYAGGQDGTLYVTTGAETVAWRGHKEPICAVSQSEGLIATASYDNHVRLWDSTGRNVFVLVGHENHVKAVQIVTPNLVMSISRDETVRLWSIPEMPPPQQEGGEEKGQAPKDGEEGQEAAPTTSGPIEKKQSNVAVISPIAVVGFSGAPHAAAVSGSNTFFGTSSDGIIGINTKDLVKTVQDFQSRNRALVREEKNKVEKERVEKANKLRAKLRSTIKAKRKELKQIEKDAAAAIVAEKLRIARERAAENEEEDAPAEEPPVEEEGGDEAPLTPEHEEELVQFTATQEKLTADLIEEGKKKAAVRMESVGPVANTKYVTDRDAFYRLPFTRHFKVDGNKQAVVCIALVGRTALVGQGNHVALTTLVPGVTTL